MPVRPRLLDEISAEAWRKIGPSSAHRRYRLEKIFGDLGLEHIGRSAGFDRAPKIDAAGVHAEEDELGPNLALAHLVGGFDAIQDGHLDIENNQIGLQPQRLLDQLDAIAHFSYNFEVVAEQAPQPIDDERMIVTDQNPRMLHVHSPGGRLHAVSDPSAERGFLFSPSWLHRREIV